VEANDRGRRLGAPTVFVETQLALIATIDDQGLAFRTLRYLRGRPPADDGRSELNEVISLCKCAGKKQARGRESNLSLGHGSSCRLPARVTGTGRALLQETAIAPTPETFSPYVHIRQQE
jgi:hypothetical protein